MIVVCTGCAAKFKVADEKVGPKGAKVRCSKCSTVFLVRHDEPVTASPPAPAPVAPPVWVGPPPLPGKRGPPPPAAPAPAARPAPAGRPELAAVLRAALDLDLEPAAPRPRSGEPPPATSAAPPPPDDPFGASFPPLAPGGTAPADDPFAPRPAEADPFAAVQAPVPDDLIRPPPAPPEQAQAAADPFDLDPFGGPPPEPAAQDDLALEERLPAPAQPRLEPTVPLDDPFGAGSSLDPGAYDFAGGHPTDIPPLAADLPGAAAPSPAPAAPPHAPEPLHVDPFASAAVDADPLRVASTPPRGGAREEAPDATPEPGRAARLRAVAINAISLAVLLAVALALLVIWRGGGKVPASLRPSSLLAAVTQRPEAAAPIVATRVTSGLYERRAGAPLLFVKGDVEAREPVGPVLVRVDLVRGGRVIASGQARAGGPLGPEALHGATDAADLARLAAEAEVAAPARLQPGAPAPFLVPFADYPADLAGVTVRITVAEAAR